MCHVNICGHCSSSVNLLCVAYLWKTLKMYTCSPPWLWPAALPALSLTAFWLSCTHPHSPSRGSNTDWPTGSNSTTLRSKVKWTLPFPVRDGQNSWVYGTFQTSHMEICENYWAVLKRKKNVYYWKCHYFKPFVSFFTVSPLDQIL